MAHASKWSIRILAMTTTLLAATGEDGILNVVVSYDGLWAE